MHDDELDITPELVAGLVGSQHPALLGSKPVRVESSGTDNALYLMDNDLAVRLPRTPRVADYLVKENKWLPTLGPQLTTSVPVPVAIGEPDDRFPYPWSIVPWLQGQAPDPTELEGPETLAGQLGAFVRELQAISPTGGPSDGRGLSVKLADPTVRMGIAALQGELDAAAVTTAWDRVLEAADHARDPVWFHGDLSAGNLLTATGALSGVIDWGRCGVGDPAIDLLPAWFVFPPAARDAYREALDVDASTWERGKGWVLAGVVGIAYYRQTNPALVGNVVRAITAVLDDRP